MTVNTFHKKTKTFVKYFYNMTEATLASYAETKIHARRQGLFHLCPRSNVNLQKHL